MPRRTAALVAGITLMLASTALVVTPLAGGAAGAAPAAPAAVAAYDTGAEAQYVAAINSYRAQNGLPALAVDGELTGAARSWTDQMAANGKISHAPSISAGVTQNWSKIGENVGEGQSVSSIMGAFIASEPHRANLLDPVFTRVGVGVVWRDGRMYTTHRFMALHGSPAPPPVTSPPAGTPPGTIAASEPEPTTPTTTTAPTTTTTTTAPPRPPAQASRVGVMLEALEAAAG